jgi:hypothetical protein
MEGEMVSITGVAEGILRATRDQDFDGAVIRDCCGAATLQEHEVCMDIVLPRIAWVASVEEVIRAIQSWPGTMGRGQSSPMPSPERLISRI